MQQLDISQRSAEWFTARLGKPTASRFAAFFTGTGALRKGVGPRRAMLELLGERLTGLPTQRMETDAMLRGIELEPRAREWYALATGAEVREVGFVASDCGRWGCSPDGLCEESGIEIKCPLMAGFLDVAESCEIPEDHAIQMHACMWITGKPRWDYVLYTETRGLSPIIIPLVANAALHAAFAAHIPAICDRLDAMERVMRERGHGVVERADDGGAADDLFGDGSNAEAHGRRSRTVQPLVGNS